VEEIGVKTDYQGTVPIEGHYRGSKVNLFADSSALAKRYVADEKSGELDELLAAAGSLGVSVLCLPEIISALCRRRRERFLSALQYKSAKAALQADLADATVIQIIDEVLLRTIRLVESNPLRAADAIHVASALVWRADLFASADARQCDAAENSGLEVVRL
jgi:predicted nucleic acid-binding protein